MICTKFMFNARLGRLLCRVPTKRPLSTTEPSKEDSDLGEERNTGTAPVNTGEGKECLVLGVYEDAKKFDLTPAAAEVDAKSGGKISKYLNDLSCELQLGKAFVVTDVLDYSAVAIASIGPKDAAFCELEDLDQARENIRWGVGAGVVALQNRGATKISVDGATAPDAAAEAATLAAWRFQEYKSCGDKKPETECSLYGAGAEGANAGGADAGGAGAGGADAGGAGGADAGGAGAGGAAQWDVGVVYGRAQNWARYMADMPANNMTPVDLAQEALSVLCPLGVRVAARERAWVAAQRMAAFLAVARGSCEAPMFLELSYDGAADQRPPVLIVAKGVTFDSGGLCLKRPSDMYENRGSMSGAAVALAAIRVLAELKVPLNVRACIPLCENMVSGQCMKLGDVVRALNGLSIQIENTDMEGRLMMADALVYGQALHRPSLVIDVATLTKGVQLATGGGAFGCFSNSTRAWRLVRRAGAVVGDRPWRFPLWRYYHGLITDDPAVDLRNQGSGKATPCIGAAFLKNFICGEWVHMDITGVGKVAHAAAPYLRARRMTGRPARTLARALQDLAAGCGDDEGKKDQ